MLFWMNHISRGSTSPAKNWPSKRYSIEILDKLNKLLFLFVDEHELEFLLAFVGILPVFSKLVFSCNNVSASKLNSHII
jgi:hypothetical protein